MADRSLYQFRYSYDRDFMDIQGKVSIGASGAPTLVRTRGIVSIVRNSAGNYTINLKDRSHTFIDCHVTFVSSTSAPAAPIINVVSEQVNNISPSMIIQCRNLSGVATDPASGEIMLLKIKNRNSST